MPIPKIKKGSVPHIILTVWIVFASLYVVYNEYNRVKVMVAERAYQAGLSNAVNKLIDETETCQPIPVSTADRSVNLISLDCLKNNDAAAEEDVE